MKTQRRVARTKFLNKIANLQICEPYCCQAERHFPARVFRRMENKKRADRLKRDIELRITNQKPKTFSCSSAQLTVPGPERYERVNVCSSGTRPARSLCVGACPREFPTGSISFVPRFIRPAGNPVRVPSADTAACPPCPAYYELS